MAKRLIVRTSAKPSGKAASKPAQKGKKGGFPEGLRRRRTDEATLLQRYPHAKAGTLRFETEGTHANKQTIEIGCTAPGCRQTRRVATSDLFQIKLCQEHAKANRKANGKAKSKKAKKA